MIYNDLCHLVARILLVVHTAHDASQAIPAIARASQYPRCYFAEGPQFPRTIILRELGFERYYRSS
jgi:hypothetical protein